MTYTKPPLAIGTDHPRRVIRRTISLLRSQPWRTPSEQMLLMLQIQRLWGQRHVGYWHEYWESEMVRTNRRIALHATVEAAPELFSDEIKRRVGVQI